VKRQIKQTKTFIKARRLYDRYERFLIPGMLVVGVTVDFITFRTIDYTTAFMLLGVYFAVAGLIIAHMSATATSVRNRRISRYAHLAAPLVLQFTFGALLSASLIFYWFSSAFSISWPILLLLAILIASNDLFRHHYQKPIVQISVYYFITFSVASLILPFIFNSIDVWVFILSGVISLVFGYGYVKLLSSRVTLINSAQRKLATSMIVIFVIMNGLYFLNVIPPIPLSIQEAGVYNEVERQSGEYALTGEEQSFFARLIPGETIRVLENGRVYVYTSIYAPSELSTTILHQWQSYDEVSGDWVTEDELGFYISGGRDDGYRGYSHKSVHHEGAWRVSVETERGQVLGRIYFDIEYVEKLPDLIDRRP